MLEKTVQIRKLLRIYLRKGTYSAISVLSTNNVAIYE